MSLPAKMDSGGGQGQQRHPFTAVSADDLLCDEDDLKDVDAMFESLLNNTFEHEEADRRLQHRNGKSGSSSGRGIAGNFPTSSAAPVSSSLNLQSSSAPRSSGNSDSVSGGAKQQQLQAVFPSNNSPSPTQSEYDTACDPWDDY